MPSISKKELQSGMQAFSTRDWHRAKQHFSRAVAQDAHAVDAYVLLSYACSYLGEYRSAREAALRAAALKSTSPETVADVAARLRTFNEGKSMVAYISRLGPPSRLPIPLLLQCAAQFSYLNLQRHAHAFLKEAYAADPEFPPSVVALSQVLTYLGRGSEVLPLLDKIVTRAPRIPEIYGLVGQLGADAPRLQNYIAMARDILAQDALPFGERAKAAFGLHHMLDRQGEYVEAFKMLEEGCRQKRLSLNYSCQESQVLFHALESMPTTGVGVRSHSLVPIFIIGMHRSGTTLLEQMLDGHSAVHGAGELYDFTSAMRYVTDHHCQGVIDATIVARASAPGFDFAEVGQRYLDGIAWRLDGKRVLTDKLPSNFLNAGFICQALPQARLLHMVRDPVEVCFSNLRELFSGANPYSYDQIELADFYLEYHRLMAHWREAFPGRILDIRYDRLVRDPEAVIREVCDFCGLDFEPEMLAIANRKRGVSTASAVQVREGIQVRDVPKWKPYEAHLQPLIRRLREGGVLEER